MTLDRIMEFVELLNHFRRVERVLRVNKEDRWENDVEHSYHLAMLAWYISSASGLEMDTDKVLRYALVHDLVEVYAGDTYFYSEDGSIDTKKEREEEALKRIAAEFSEFQELESTIRSYEGRSDREARFVYALDKVQPVLQIYLDGGRTWREKAVTLEMLLSKKKGKVDVSPEVMPIFEELTALLKERQGELFHK